MHGTYLEVFPEILKLVNILLALPVRTATVDIAFSEIKLVKIDLTGLAIAMAITKFNARNWNPG